MTADTGTLTTILEQFLNIFKLGQKDVFGSAWDLLTTLATLELLLASLWWALTGQDALVGLIRRILTIGFFVFVIQNYDSLTHVIVDGFIQTGKTASSNGGDNLASVRDPSSIVDAGFVVAFPILDHISSYSGTDVVFHLHDIIISGICALGILLAYFIIAIQVFVTYLEFALISTLGLILVPFGVFKHTTFLAEKVFGAIISFGVKLMVLGLLVSVTIPVLRNFTLPPDPTWEMLFNNLLVSFAVAALSWHAPGIAAGLLSGGPSLTAGTAAGTALAGAAGAVAAPYIGSAAARGGISTVSNVVSKPSTFAASVIGTASAGAQVTSSAMANKGYGPAGQMAGTLLGATTAVGSRAVQATITKPLIRARDALSNAYHSKQTQVRGFPDLLKTRGSQASATNASSDNGEGKSTRKKPSFEKVATSLHLAKQAVPHTAQPQAGVSVPLKSPEDKSE